MTERKPQKIKGLTSKIGVVIDLLMLGLIILDLFWLMFDALYQTQTIRQIVDAILPFDYSPIHQDFYFYDGFILSIFILEFAGRWLFSIYKKHYDKWFFYPFIHWYDLLGCIPTSSFRILRLLRIISLVYRLHRWKVIDLEKYTLFKILKQYYQIALEEVSDKVVVTVLNQAQNEIVQGKSLSLAIITEVIAPKKEELSLTISEIVQDGIREKYPQYQKILQNHITTVVKKEVGENKEVKQLGKLPIIGQQIEINLQTAISKIVFGVIDHLVLDAAKAENAAMIQLISNSVLEVLLEHNKLKNNELGNEILIKTIDLIRERVEIQQWKNKI